MPHPTQGARDQIHDPAEEIRDCSNGQDLQSAPDYFAVRRIDSQELLPEHIGSDAQHACHAR